jgi:uncharacterized protein (TIGR03086 family)
MSTFLAHSELMTNPDDNNSTPHPDRRPALFEAFSYAARVLSKVTPDQLADPTPCPDYDISALIDHLVGASWRAVEIGRGDTPSGDEFPHVELADAPTQLHQASQDAKMAWTDERLAATTIMPWGETYTGSTLVDMYLSEIMAHAWDLLVAIEQPRTAPEPLAESALAAARSMLKPEYRDMMGTGNPFGAEQPVRAEDTTFDRFAAFMGRTIPRNLAPADR